MVSDSKSKKLSFGQKFQRKARYVRLNSETFEEERSFTLSRLNMLIYLLFGIIVVISLSFLLFAYTPLNTLIPNVPDPTLKKEQVQIDKKNLSEIEKISGNTEAQIRYNQNLIALLSGETPKDYLESATDSSKDYSNIEFPSSTEDRLLREKVEQEDKFSVSGKSPNESRDDKMKGVFFFTPLQGEVTNSFNSSGGHNGVDIIAPENEAVKSTLDGTVIFVGWTSENGHVIQVQHAHNLISIYKHNSVLLKSVGDKVQAGDPIAIVGNTGSLSTGAHLHFELWYNGNSINPQEFIAF
jgi:murein DD-endopeptidase MepM/ murein hydrolase activator NlpD